MSAGVSELRWGIERRLEFIEFRLYWEGGINRSDIVEQFGVSVPQASKDLSRYQELAPDNMAYDKSEKRYFPAPHFVPRFYRPDPDEHLAQLNAVATLAVPPQETWLSRTPNVDSLPALQRKVEPEVLRALLDAVKDERALEILYQSMNPVRPEPVWRGISPHAFANDGYRWHVRAFCHIDSSFKDFLLSRCLDYRPAGRALGKPSDDRDWTQVLDVELRPNPKLSKSQQLVISDDYGMENGKLKVSIRKSLFFYFERHHRLDLAEAVHRPQEAPVVIERRIRATSQT
ncbi:MAG: WYL domain-containing protein [Rhodospirillales bacterium]|nr:WYL domain-containing protein [Rhodospirillales bacterium]